MALIKHRDQVPEPAKERPFALFPAFPRWFDDMFTGEDGGMIKVEQFTEGGKLVVRADMPGIDPEKDVEVTVEGGLLHIRAERREEEETNDRDFHRRELRYGSFTRTLPLPDDMDEASVTATYKDGILEVRAPLPPAPPKSTTRRVTVDRG